MASVEPEIAITNFLRTNLTDPNSGSRSGTQWVYDDFPRTKDLTLNSFPRVGVTKLAESGGYNSIAGDNIVMSSMSVQIDVVTKKDLICSVTTTDEAVAVISNSPVIQLVNRPYSVTNIKHDAVAFGTVTLVANDAAFGSPSAGTVEVSSSTGNLNFATADLSSYSGESITSTYVIKLEGTPLVRYLGREIVKLFRNNWRTNAGLSNLFDPVTVNNSILNLEEESGIFRNVIEYDFKSFNVGE